MYIFDSYHLGFNKTSDAPPDVETRIPVIEERLNVQKRESMQEATITKEPLTEKKTAEVPVMHEEVIIERRPAGETQVQRRRKDQYNHGPKLRFHSKKKR